MPSLSQKYRPRRFADVTGQQHVTETLRAEVATGSLGHAFLFSGPRGVGKTTCARILAKALGCNEPQNGEPCGSCPSCTTFQEGRSIDVIEIDAATHTGVDMIREAIVEHVRFTPAGKRKVYILDEAHMLSTASWNALLKTLEEPPAYAFFVFATTEWHKVPATIVSRCQRFEFRRIKEVDMVARLQEIAKSEQWQADEDVLKLIASRAEGCQRDAETLLGQVGSLADAGKVTMATAGLVMPFSAFEHALAWLELCRDDDAAKAVDAFKAWYDAGVSFPTLMDDLLQLIKRLLLAQANPEEARSLAQGTAEEQRLAGMSATWTGMELHNLALVLIDRRRDLKLGMDPVFVMLLAFTKAVSVKGGVSASSQPRPAPSAAVLPSVRPEPAAATVVAMPEPQPVSPPAASAPIATPIRSEPVAAPIPGSAPVSTMPVVPLAPVPVAPVLPAADAVPSPTEGSPAPEVASTDGKTIDLATARRQWNAFIRAVEEQNHSLPFVLKISRPERVEGNTLVIRFPYPFHRDKVIGDTKNLRLVEACAQKVFEAPSMHLDGIVLAPEEEQTAGGTASPQDVVGNLLKTFGGSVVDAG